MTSPIWLPGIKSGRSNAPVGLIDSIAARTEDETASALTRSCNHLGQGLGASQTSISGSRFLYGPFVNAHAQCANVHAPPRSALCPWRGRPWNGVRPQRGETEPPCRDARLLSYVPDVPFGYHLCSPCPPPNTDSLKWFQRGADKRRRFFEAFATGASAYSSSQSGGEPEQCRFARLTMPSCPTCTLELGGYTILSGSGGDRCCAPAMASTRPLLPTLSRRTLVIARVLNGSAHTMWPCKTKRRAGPDLIPNRANWDRSPGRLSPGTLLQRHHASMKSQRHGALSKKATQRRSPLQTPPRAFRKAGLFRCHGG